MFTFLHPEFNRAAHPHESHRTLRDGTFGGRFPRHFVPGYDRTVPQGTFPTGFNPLIRCCGEVITPIIASVRTLALIHTVPYGTGLSGWRFPRHFVPGYDHAVPLGQNTFSVTAETERMSHEPNS
jgi:hypothetical protein